MEFLDDPLDLGCGVTKPVRDCTVADLQWCTERLHRLAERQARNAEALSRAVETGTDAGALCERETEPGVWCDRTAVRLSRSNTGQAEALCEVHFQKRGEGNVIRAILAPPD